MIRHLRFYDERRQSDEKTMHQLWMKLAQVDELQKLNNGIKDKGLDKYNRLLDLYTD